MQRLNYLANTTLAFLLLVTFGWGQVNEQIIIDDPSDTAPATISQDQTLIVRDGGKVEGLGAEDATIHIEGGVAGEILAIRTDVAISGGTIPGPGREPLMLVDSNLEVSNGDVAFFSMWGNSRATIRGGYVDGVAIYDYDANSTIPQLHVSSGTVRELIVLSGGEILVSGGNVEDFTSLGSGLFRLVEGAVGNAYVDTDSSSVISGGQVTGLFESYGGTFSMSGGFVRELQATYYSETMISGGEIRLVRGNWPDVVPATIGITGGSVGKLFASSASTISGGEVDSISAGSMTTLEITASEFLLNGNVLESIPLNGSVVFSDRDVTLSGTFADGTPFEFDLNSTGDYNSLTRDFFSPEATLILTLLPEPTSFLSLLVASALLACRRYRVHYLE